MGQDFFAYLPSEIIIDILSRLQIPTIIRCKIVCKSWLNLLETHLSKPVPGLAVVHTHCYPGFCKIFQFDDVLNLQQHELHYNLVTEFALPRPYIGDILGSVNGLLFQCDMMWFGTLCIYNPTTREYIRLHCSQDFVSHFGEEVDFVSHFGKEVSYGFGVSQVGGQYKVVRISQYLFKKVECECHVYTLGTGSWRSIKSHARFKYIYDRPVFLNGNLHWLVDLNGSTWIFHVDLETEVFSTFSTPLLPIRKEHAIGLSALGDCLCFCDNTFEDKIVIWLMKEYGNDKSWTKEFVIEKGSDYFGECGKCYKAAYPIKLFKDGDILIALEYSSMIYYSNKTKTIQKIDMCKVHADSVVSVLHTPSFLSLKNFTMENVGSF